jgi:hypothetical protein
MYVCVYIYVCVCMYVYIHIPTVVSPYPVFQFLRFTAAQKKLEN